MRLLRLISSFFILPLAIWLSADLLGQSTSTPPAFAIGVIADCQYCECADQNIRKYNSSPAKLQQCVDHLNTLPLEYTIHLGDFIDRDFESFKVVSSIYNQLNMPHHHVLGNHDFSVADAYKAEVPAILDMEKKYYDFSVKDWRFVALDGNDLSMHAYPKGSADYEKSLAYHQQAGGNAPDWNGAIGSDQLDWLKNILSKADQSGEKVVLYCHFPVYPEDTIHNLWNAQEVIDLIETHYCVKAYINGHNHKGNYASKAGVHYYNLKGMVDTEETSYAVIRFYEDRLEITGYGREEDRVMMIK